MKRTIKQTITFLSIMTTCFLQLSCQNKKLEEPKIEKPSITVSIEPIRFFTEAIVGDHFNVTSMVPKGVSPEAYDPTPQQMMGLSKSIAYLFAGKLLGYEQTWNERMKENAKETTFFDLSKNVELITEEDGATDPHIWNSPKNAFVIARNILDAAKELDPGNAEEYAQRYSVLINEIAKTDSLIRTELNNESHDKSFLIFHPALTYYAHEYGLTQLSIEKEGKEPSASDIKAVIDEARKAGVRTVFVQPEFDHHNAESVAEQAGARIAEVNPLAYDWQKEMVNIAKELNK